MYFLILKTVTLKVTHKYGERRCLEMGQAEPQIISAVLLSILREDVVPCCASGSREGEKCRDANNTRK